MNRDFRAEKPNQKWVTDVTELSLFGEKLYLSPNSRSAQQRSGQLYHIGSPCAQHGDKHAERGICKNSRRNKPHSPFFFGLPKSELLYLQKFRSMEHFKQELVAYLDDYNIRRIKAKLKGLPPAIHRQQALSAA